jgi:anaerobic selenocysteine-containing dehydrogenase
MADHRLRLASSHMVAFAAALALKVTGDADYAKAAAGSTSRPEWIAECAADLLAHQGGIPRLAGSHLPEEAHAIAYAINEFLGNFGTTVDFIFNANAQAVGIAAWRRDREGAVKTLVILGGNPVYNAPADLDWATLQKSVPQVIRHGYYADETSALAGTHLAAAHYLESWGDARTWTGPWCRSSR